jgi:hypothetical protein
MLLLVPPVPCCIGDCTSLLQELPLLLMLAQAAYSSAIMGQRTLTEASVAEVDCWWSLGPCCLWLGCKQRCCQHCCSYLAATVLLRCWLLPE